MKDSIIKSIQECLKNIGVFAEEGFETQEIGEYIEDSLTLIMFIIELEQCFKVEITDDDLSVNSLNSFPGIIEIVSKLLDKKGKDKAMA